MTNGGFDNQQIGSLVVIDSIISAVTGILTHYLPGYSSAQSSGTLVLENVDFTDSPVAVANPAGRVDLPGGQLVALYGQGNAWTTEGADLNGQTFNSTTCTYQNASQTGYTAQESTIQRLLAPIPRPSNLVDSTGKYFARSKPQYETIPASGFLSSKSNGCVGDGVAGSDFNSHH
jgi:glucan 1,3-beta-glucosidase